MENNLRTKPLRSIQEWNKIMFPHKNVDEVFNEDKDSPEVIAIKWAKRAIGMLPKRPMPAED